MSHLPEATPKHLTQLPVQTLLLTDVPCPPHLCLSPGRCPRELPNLPGRSVPARWGNKRRPFKRAGGAAVDEGVGAARREQLAVPESSFPRSPWPATLSQNRKGWLSGGRGSLTGRGPQMSGSGHLERARNLGRGHRRCIRAREHFCWRE